MKENILITGAGGFIGSHLAESCVGREYKVRAFVHYNSKNTWGWLDTSEYKDQIEIISGDIRDYDSVCDAIQGCNKVFHLAALIGIPYSYVTPLAYIKTNIEGTYNILQATREIGVKKIIHTSSSEVYGSAQFVPISEKHPISPQSPYAATKAAADLLALSFYRSFELPVAIVRPFNTYGPRQSARAVIPSIIIQALSGKKRIKLGSVFPSRDLSYIKDTVSGIIAVSESDKSIGRVINLGMNLAVSIKELARLIADIMKVDIEIETEEKRVRPEKSEVTTLMADTEKARNLLGWSPKYSLEEGLRDTIEWFKNNLILYKTDIYNV